MQVTLLRQIDVYNIYYILYSIYLKDRFIGHDEFLIKMASLSLI